MNYTLPGLETPALILENLDDHIDDPVLLSVQAQQHLGALEEAFQFHQAYHLPDTPDASSSYA
jgi:hypothetical protein